MDLLVDYLKNPSDFVEKKTFSDHGKTREIVTYNGKDGNILREKHELVLEKLEKLPSADCSYAYKKNVKAIDAATPHLGNITFLKLDIKGFFDHIDTKLLKEKLEKEGCDIDLDLCLLEGKLPIGFVTSPKLSDFYLYELDKSIEKYIAEHPGLKCSRYADDFLLSSPSEDFDDVLKLGQFIKDELKKFNLELNEEKTIKAKLGKQTSIRFIGLNIGKDKVTLCKWFILKTINAFKRYHIARYNKSDDVSHLKSIAFGMYNYILQTSESAKARFLKKYQNTFNKPFPTELEKVVKDEAIKYVLDENGETYTAKIDFEGLQPESLIFRDEINGAKVATVVNDTYGDELNNVKRIKLPSNLVACKLPYYSLRSLESNPIMDIVNLRYLTPKNNIDIYKDITEIGILRPDMDRYDYSEDIYLVKKVPGGYEAKHLRYGSWGVIAFDRYKKENAYFVQDSPLASNLFYYFAEQIKNNRYAYGYGRESYVIEGNKMLRSPQISLKQLAVIQFFFENEIVKENTKHIHGKFRLVDDNNAKEHKVEKDSDDYFEVTLPFMTKIIIGADFGLKEKDCVFSHTIFDSFEDGRYIKEKSMWDIPKDERIKDILLGSLKEYEDYREDSPFVIKYNNKKYSASKIRTSVYHLLQFISPIGFTLDDRYLINDGYGEYLFAGCGENEIKPSQYQGINSLRIVRISDELTGREPANKTVGIKDGAFKDCKNLEKVYISRSFFAYRNEDRLFFGENVFEGCDKLDDSIILFPSEDKDYVSIKDGKVQRQDPIQLTFEKEEDIKQLDDLPRHSSVEITCAEEIYGFVAEKVDHHKNVVKWMLRRLIKREPPQKEIVKKEERQDYDGLEVCDDDLPF